MQVVQRYRDISIWCLASGGKKKPRRVTFGVSWSRVLPLTLVGLWAGGLYEFGRLTAFGCLSIEDCSRFHGLVQEIDVLN